MEMMENKSSSLKPIDINKSRYPLDTFFGRWRHFINITSPLTLFNSNQDILNAQRLLFDYSIGKRNDLNDSYQTQEKVWKAKQVVDSSLHPDTKKPIPLPFRMSAFVPTNLIIATGLLLPNPTIISIIGWQWANQTLNICVNYSNANKTIEMKENEIIKAYISATLTSVGLAVGLNKLAKPKLIQFLGEEIGCLFIKFLPFFSVASAGLVNIFCMRWKEIRDGIDVFSPVDDHLTQSIGKSRIAGAYAVGQTAASRVLTNIPSLILPPLIMTILQKRGTFKGPRGRLIEMISNLGLIGGSLFIFLPPAIAAFPQRAQIQTSNLENHFSSLIDSKTNKPFPYLQFNKGL